MLAVLVETQCQVLLLGMLYFQNAMNRSKCVKKSQHRPIVLVASTHSAVWCLLSSLSMSLLYMRVFLLLLNSTSQTLFPRLTIDSPFFHTSFLFHFLYLLISFCLVPYLLLLPKPIINFCVFFFRGILLAHTGESRTILRAPDGLVFHALASEFPSLTIVTLILFLHQFLLVSPRICALIRGSARYSEVSARRYLSYSIALTSFQPVFSFSTEVFFLRWSRIYRKHVGQTLAPGLLFVLGRDSQ